MTVLLLTVFRQGKKVVTTANGQAERTVWSLLAKLSDVSEQYETEEDFTTALKANLDSSQYHLILLTVRVLQANCEAQTPGVTYKVRLVRPQDPVQGAADSLTTEHPLLTRPQLVLHHRHLWCAKHHYDRRTFCCVLPHKGNKPAFCLRGGEHLQRKSQGEGLLVKDPQGGRCYLSQPCCYQEWHGV